MDGHDPKATKHQTHAVAMEKYLEEGEKKALTLGNKGPIRFQSNGNLEGDILDYYQTHRSEFVREFPEIRARQILVPDREALSQVWERLRGGEIFQVVAREESIDSSAEDGGELGYFSKNSADASFWEACQKARKGKQIRISTQLGYHIIEVLDRREVGSVPDLIEVRGKIWQRLYAQRRQAKREKILEELRNRFSWSIFLEQIEDDITSPK